jgi:hypothetical protein
MKNKSNVRLKRSALTVALGMCFASTVAFGQSAVGSLFGSAEAGSKVTIQNVDSGTSREITVGKDGRFAVSQLPPGTYKVTSGSKTNIVAVRVGTGSSVDFAKEATLDTVTVTASQVNSIDVSSVESTTVFTAEQLEKLPVSRDVTSVALLAPGTVKGDTGFGNLASFGGASVAENGYYVNGFNVTNLRTMLSFANIPFEGIGQQQVKTGGYGAEYGRSLGGVIGIVTKRGTNEWKSGASVIYNPDWGRMPGKDVLSKNPDDIANGDIYSSYRSDNNSNSINYNIYAGGPLIEDRLFFFGLVQAKDNSSESFGRDSSSYAASTSPSALVKLDWNITDNHLFELTAIHNEAVTSYADYQNPTGDKYTGEHGNRIAGYNVETGGDIYIAKYTGYLTDNFTLSLQGGYSGNLLGDIPPLPGANCVAAYDSRLSTAQLDYIGCWNESQFTVTDIFFGPNKDTRVSYRLDMDWRIGDHTIRAGYDTETYTSDHPGLIYSGGGYYRHYRTGATARTVNGVSVAPNTNYYRFRNYQTASASYDVINTATYLEDSWQVNQNLLLYIGLRNETFENLNGSGETFVQADNLWAPRLGFSWDIAGDSSMKLYGNAGRYFIPVASNTNIRGAGSELFTQDFFYSTGVDTVTGLPIGSGAQIGPTAITSDGTVPDPRTVAATNLSPMYQDEYILGFQKMFENGWSAGIKAVYRDIKSGMDDYCSTQPFQDWATDNGYTNFDYHSLASCFLLNPGQDTGIAMDLEDDGNLVEVVVPSSYFDMPKYKRSYSAVEFTAEKSTQDWSLQASYTWSKSYGNVEGYVNSSLEQEDAGATQDFDHALFEDGANGYLPNDRRHVIKAFGSYNLSEEWRVGGNFVLSSGRPVNCFGYAPANTITWAPDANQIALYGSSSFYCYNADDTVTLGSRGDRGRTPWTWTLDASVAYMPEWGKEMNTTFKLDVFNIFNNDTVTEYNETSAFGGYSNQEYNPNFLNDVNYQAPRSLRFTASIEF